MPFNARDIARLRNVKTRSISPENVDGAKGGGGRATQGTGAHAARDLGFGWKISPSVIIGSGTSFPMATIDGPGTITHIWLTTHCDHWRTLVLRAYWDHAPEPAVEVPLGDFFANGWVRFAQVSSSMIAVNPHGGFNSYWPMLFQRHARLTVENLRDRPWREPPASSTPKSDQELDMCRISAPRNAADHVAVMLEGGDDLRERCDGFGPVTAAVVHEHDAARPDAAAGGGLDDLLRAGSAPVPGIDRPQHFTKTLSAQDALHGPVGRAVRRPHASASRSVGKLPLNLSRRQLGQIGMVIGVIADIAALGPDLGRLCGVLGLSEAELEERGRGVRGSQDVEDGRGVRAGSVVEGQVYRAGGW
jgi:Protein of unknown function (DUF2961)